MKLPLLAIAFLVLLGCDRVSFTREQAQEVAQAREDFRAAQASAATEAREVLWLAGANRLEAGTANAELPPPFTPAAALVSSTSAVAQESEDAQAAKDNPPPGWGSQVWAGLGGAAVFVLGLLRMSPGFYGMAAGLLHSLLAPRLVREERKAQVAAQDTATAAVAFGRDLVQVATAAGLGDKVEEVKAKAGELQDRTGVRPYVDAILDALKGKA